MKYVIGLLLLFCGILNSCAQKEKTLPTALSEAESVMWEYPDSALFILWSMPQPSFSDKEAYATWSLLLMQARDKAYGHRLPDSLNIPVSESLVENALTYFEKENNVKRKAQAYFYKGQLLADKNEYTEAIPYLLKAKDIMEELDEPLFTFLICQTLGNIYCYQNLHDESVEQLKDAYQYALNSNSGEKVTYALSELGRTYTMFGELDSALSYFQKSLENSKKLGDLKLEGMVMGELGAVYGELKEYDKALLCAKEELSLYTNLPSVSNLAQAQYGLGYAFWQTNQLDSAMSYLKQSLNTDNLYTMGATYNTLYHVCVEKGDYKKAINYNEQYLICSDSIQAITHSRELSEIQAKYDYEKLLNMNYRLLIDKSRQGIIGLAIILTLLGILILYQYRIRRGTKSLQEAKEEIRYCKIRMEINEKQIRNNEERITHLTQDAIYMDELCLRNEDLHQQNVCLNAKINKNMRLLQSQHTTLGELLPYFDKLENLRAFPRYLEGKDWLVLIEWANLLYNNFVIRLEADIPGLTEMDKQYCCLLKMGFTNPEISVFMAVSPASVAKQKQRLKFRIKKSDLVLEDQNLSLDQFLKDY